MARTTRHRDIFPPGLLKLPNEILLDIVCLLRTPDVRRLGRANRKLRFFVEDYLIRYRYNAGLSALPNELMFKIVEHLGRQKDRSSLARASQRFYPLIMDNIVRHNVRYGGSSLLNYSVKKNLRGMARTILRLGADVNTQYGSGQDIMNKRPTPLATAAFYGRIRMVAMLLKAGASHFVDGMRIPLAVAIVKRHKNVALALSLGLDSGVVLLEKSGETVLQMACAAELVDLVQHCLQKGSQLRNLNTALYRTIKKDASDDTFIKRGLHEDAYQIVLLLLKHGADPDVPVQTRFSHTVTARAVASRHPDPRLRNLLSKTTPVTEPKESSLLIGRPWLSSEDGTLTVTGLSSEPMPSEVSCYTTLWDVLQKSTAKTATLTSENESECGAANNENGSGNGERDDEDSIPYASSIGELTNRETRDLNKVEPMEAPPLSSYPQLGIAKIRAQHVSKASWAEKPMQTYSSVAQKPRASGLGATSQTAKQSKKPAGTELFPRLGRPGSTYINAGKSLWPRRSTERLSQGRSATQAASPREDNGVRPVAHKPSKKKKWQPLSIGD